MTLGPIPLLSHHRFPWIYLLQVCSLNGFNSEPGGGDGHQRAVCPPGQRIKSSEKGTNMQERSIFSASDIPEGIHTHIHVMNMMPCELGECPSTAQGLFHTFMLRDSVSWAPSWVHGFQHESDRKPQRRTA